MVDGFIWCFRMVLICWVVVIDVVLGIVIMWLIILGRNDGLICGWLMFLIWDDVGMMMLYWFLEYVGKNVEFFGLMMYSWVVCCW